MTNGLKTDSLFVKEKQIVSLLFAIITAPEIVNTVEPQLSEPSGRHTIRPDNRGVRIDEGNGNSPSVGYRVGDNLRNIDLMIGVFGW